MADPEEGQLMYQRFQRASLAPDGFAVDDLRVDGDLVQLRLRSRQAFGVCPACGRRSGRVQSRYVRRPRTCLLLVDLSICRL